MIRLFKKQNTVNQTGIFPFQSVMKLCDAQLRKLSKYLSDKAQRIPKQKLASVLISACLIITIILCCKLFYLYKYRSHIEFHSISAPAVKSSYLYPADDAVFKRIKKFHHYLDSLKTNNRFAYDSIMMRRPHLMDSIIAIEKFTNQ